MITDLDEYDALPPKDRLPRFLQHALKTDDYEARTKELSERLNYIRPNVVRMWIEGTMLMPMKALPTIAAFLGFDPAHLLPLWVASYIGDQDNDEMYRVAKRTLSVWEFVVVGACRDVYLGDDDHDEGEIEDDG